VSCAVPTAQNGIFHKNGEVVTKTKLIAHTDIVGFKCAPGYNIHGPETLRCWYGSWAVVHNPECIPGSFPSRTFFFSFVFFAFLFFFYNTTVLSFFPVFVYPAGGRTRVREKETETRKICKKQADKERKNEVVEIESKRYRDRGREESEK
jgi:hypothetical protein